jgi:hypothetical protein
MKEMKEMKEKASQKQRARSLGRSLGRLFGKLDSLPDAKTQADSDFKSGETSLSTWKFNFDSGHYTHKVFFHTAAASWYCMDCQVYVE